MQHLFLSYAHVDKPLDREFHDQLKQRGLRVWHDDDQFSPGSILLPAAQNALNTLPGAVFLLTPKSVMRPFIRKVELQCAGARKQTDPSFRVVFVLCDIKFEDAEATVLECAGLHLRSHLYETLSLPDSYTAEERSNAIGAVCDRISKSFINDALDTITQTMQTACRIGVYTHADAEPSDHDVLSFDWRSLFEDAVPTPRIWAERLQPALEQAVITLQAHNIRDVRLHGYVHMSPAIALGFAFRPVRGLSVTINQRGEDWQLDERCDPDPDLKLTVIEGTGPFDAADWSIEVSISRDVTSAVNQLIKDRTFIVRQRQLLSPALGVSKTYVRDGADGNAIAAAVAQAISIVRQAKANARTHLFVASPMAVAVCIGAHLNRCGPVQVYEYVEAAGTYCPSCQIESR